MKKNDLLDLSNTNILLISDDRQDYEAILNYQYKNVDYFSSHIVAFKYFKEHPEMLKQYNMILFKGDTSYSYRLPFEISLMNFMKQFAKLYIQDNTLVWQYIKDPSNGSYRVYKIIKDDYRAYSYIECEDFINLINRAETNILLNENAKVKKYTPIKLNAQHFPVRMSDIKILYLNSFKLLGDVNKIKEELAKLGITNVEFSDETTFNLNSKVIERFGEYDIVISSYMNSPELMSFQKELAGQTEYYGRNLSMLVRYHDNVVKFKHEQISFSYCLAGIKAGEVESYTSYINQDGYNYPLVYKKEVKHYKDDSMTELIVVECALNQYLQALKNIGHGITDAHEYSISGFEVYNDVFAKKKAQEEIDMEEYHKLYRVISTIERARKTADISKDMENLVITNLGISNLYDMYAIDIMEGEKIKYRIELKPQKVFSGSEDFSIITYIDDKKTRKDFAFWNTNNEHINRFTKSVYPNDEEKALFYQLSNLICSILEPLIDKLYASGVLKTYTFTSEIEKIKTVKKINKNVLIKLVDEIVENAECYLMFCHKGNMIPQVKIESYNDDYIISCYNSSRIICQIEINRKNHSLIKLSSLDKNGHLTKPKKINLNNDCVSDDDAKRISIVGKQVATYIHPVIQGYIHSSLNTGDFTSYPYSRNRHKKSDW
ncbi:MAG: hypothetical protein IJO33_05430 [Bacilli bacterium]|nr:hypothetical protein [Bacilli bacterium]